MSRVGTYVAIGDSFTAGTGCEPGEAWPDLLAAALRAKEPRLAYRNLAEHGAASARVELQLPPALRMSPDLVTVVFGANDVLGTTRPDPRAYAGTLGAAFAVLRARLPGVMVVTATVPEQWDFLGLGPRTSARVERGIAAVNRATREVAARNCIPCLDVTGHYALADPDSFSPDGLHPSAHGHRLAAAGFADLLRESFGIEIDMEGVHDGEPSRA